MNIILVSVMAVFLGISYYWGFREGQAHERKMRELEDSVKRN